MRRILLLASPYGSSNSCRLSPRPEQPILTFGLGTWQIKRLNWKMNLIDELDEKLAKPPMRLPAKIE